MVEKQIRLPSRRPGPTPEELLAARERFARVAPKFGVAGLGVMLAGLALTIGVAVYAWYAFGAVLIPAGIGVVVSGGAGVALFNLKWRAQHEAEKIDLTLRKMGREGKGAPN